MLKMNCSAHILCRPINKSNEREDIGWNMKIRSENTIFFFAKLEGIIFRSEPFLKLKNETENSPKNG